MNKELTEKYSSIKKIIEQALIPAINERLDKHRLFLEVARKKLNGISKKNAGNINSLVSFASYKNEMLQATEQFSKSGMEEIEKEFEEYLSKFDLFLNTVPNKIKRKQLQDRFIIQDDDRVFIKIIKPFKKVCFSISKWPEKAANSFRQLQKKEKKKLTSWHHEIHLRNLVRYFLEEKYLYQSRLILNEYYQVITLTSLKIWSLDEQMDRIYAQHFSEINQVQKSIEVDKCIDEALIEVDEAKKEIEKKLLKAFEVCWKQFHIHFEKIGTVEYSNKKVGPNKSDKLRSKTKRDFDRLNRAWGNTILGLTDDWQIDLELIKIIFDSLDEYYTVKKEVENRIEDRIFKKIDTIIQFVKSSKDRLSKAGSDKVLKSLLVKEIAQIGIELRPLVNDTIDYLVNQDLPELINSVGDKTTLALSNVSTKRAIIKGGKFDVPTRSPQLNFISPNELINYDLAPKLNGIAKDVNLRVIGHINEAQNILLRLSEIAIFNLDSSLTAISENKEQTGLQVALDGLSRTLDQINNVKYELKGIENNLEENLLPGIKLFSNGLIQFTNNENILELRVRIARAKAAERTRVFRKQLIVYIKNLIPIVFGKLKRLYDRIVTFFKTNIKRLGLTNVKENISTELADFLAESESSIRSLPFVYQRLFRVAPLKDANFFEGRRVEIGKLINAYNQWTQGKFAASLLVGEKGAGITSLFNLYFDELGNSYSVIRLFPEQHIGTTKELLKFFEEALKTPITDAEELVQKLNNGDKKIILLENLQKLYLKKVGGFECVKLITELISLTRHNIFWIVGCTEHAYHFLNKTNNISDHFGYNIKLEELSSDDIINIIDKRHKVSGYNLEFEPGIGDQNNKKFNSMAVSEQQAYLKKEFFNELNRITKSNISIALIYWLRSTKQISENTISINSISDIDFSFMKGLSSDKLFLLTMLLLHDGLTEKEIMLVANKNSQISRSVLYPLFEDGIVIRDGDTFLINPLLYRQTVSLLLTKNILH